MYEKKTPQQWMADEPYRGIVVVKPRPPQEGLPFLTWWNTPVTDDEFYTWLCQSQLESRVYVQGAGMVQHPLPEEES
jgi:ABC-type thiamine transport system substrate-binding protein